MNEKSRMIDLADVNHFVDNWCAWNDVHMTDVYRSHNKADAIPAHSNNMVTCGIGYRLMIGARPCTFASLQHLCVAESNKTAHSASANQIKCALKDWLFRTSELELAKGGVTADTLFDWKPNFAKQV